MISDSTFYRYTIVIDVFSNEINKTHLKMRPVWFDIFLSLWAKLEYTQTSGYILLFGRVHVNSGDSVWSGWRHCIPRTLHEDQPYIIGQEVTVSNGCPRNTPSSDYKISWELNRLIDNSHKLIVSQQNYSLKIVNIYVFIKCPISSGNHYLKEHELITMLLK